MGAKDPRVDAYIAKAPAFAKPILTELRATVHGACPDVEEGIKWGHVHFGYRGMMCGMAAFKQHATFMFWKQKLVFGADDTRWSGELSKLTTKADLPAKRALAGYIRKARSEEHTSELQSLRHLVCRLLLEKKKKQYNNNGTKR